jgi:hypothetical protein
MRHATRGSGWPGTDTKPGTDTTLRRSTAPGPHLVCGDATVVVA